MYAKNLKLVVRLTLAVVFCMVMTSNLLAVSREDEVTKSVNRVKDSAVTITRLVPAVPGGRIGHPVGAGAIVDERHGMVLTCQHVVDGAVAFGVLLADGTELVALKVFEDAGSDLAVLQIRNPGKVKLQEVRVTSCNDLMLAERTFVIGAPRGNAHSVTFGRVSNLSRTARFPDGNVMKDLVQIDAAINPNSGGPAFNINGELIGTVNSMSAPGNAYFIKGDVADGLLCARMSCIARSKTVHGITGRVKIVKAEGDDRQQLVVEQASGPAREAGLEPQDVICEVAKFNVRNRFDLERLLWDAKAGEQVPITVLRDGKPVRLKLTMGKWDPAKEAAKAMGSFANPLFPFIPELMPEK